MLAKSITETQIEKTIPETLRRMNNELGATARFIWLNISDEVQRDSQLRNILGDEYAQLDKEIKSKTPCPIEGSSIKDMRKGEYGREFYEILLSISTDIQRTVNNQKIHEAIIGPELSLIMERERDQQLSFDLKYLLIILQIDYQKIINKKYENEIRQKTAAVIENLRADSRAIAELKALTISAEKEQKRLLENMAKIENILFEATEELKRKQDLTYALEFGDRARKFEKFIGRWKFVKAQWAIEEHIDKHMNASFTFEPVEEGLKWSSRFGSDCNTCIFTTDEAIEKKLKKEGQNCALVEFQSHGSFKYRAWTYTVMGNSLIHTHPLGILTFEKS